MDPSSRQKPPDGDLGMVFPVSHCVTFPPDASYHLHDDNQGDRTPLGPGDSRIQNLPQRVLCEGRGQARPHQANRNGGPSPMNPSALEEHVVDGLTLVSTLRAEPIIHTPQLSTFVVEESVIQDSPNQNAVSMESGTPPNLLPDSHPLVNRQVFPPSTIQLPIIRSGLSQKNSPLIVMEVPTLPLLLAHSPLLALAVFKLDLNRWV